MWFFMIYNLKDNENVINNLGNLNGDKLTVYGNGHSIISYDFSGINVGFGKILNIIGVGNDSNSITGFKGVDGAFINNAGTTNMLT